METLIPRMARSYRSMTSTFPSMTIIIAFFQVTTLNGSNVELRSNVHSITFENDLSFLFNVMVK